jgi:sulfide:quinone oxidoreductase
MKRMNIVVAGNSFAGFTAAIELKRLVGYDHEIIVIGRSPEFVFSPSLVWFPFGLRKEEDIVFDVRVPFHHMDIKFFEAEIESFDLSNRRVWLHDEFLPYDYLLVATGFKPDYESVPGSGPGKFSHSLNDLHSARESKRAWCEYMKNGGPIVVAAAQNTTNYGAAYEFLLNVRYQLMRASMIHKTKLTFVTSEPFLGHLGIGGIDKIRENASKMFELHSIEWIANASIKEVRPEMILLDDGTEIPSKYTMIMPGIKGADVVLESSGLGNSLGFIEVNDEYRHHEFPDVYAAGMAVYIDETDEAAVGNNAQRTSYPTEMMAKTAAWNIFADIFGLEKKSLPFSEILAFSALDASNHGMMIIGDHMLSPRGFEMIIPGPQVHWAKMAHERYFMVSRSRGII